MPAQKTRPAPAAAVPDPRDAIAVTNGRSTGPDPIPPERVWLMGLGQSKLHRVTYWTRAENGNMYARCGRAAASFWVEPQKLFPQLPRCLDCEDVDDARQP